MLNSFYYPLFPAGDDFTFVDEQMLLNENMTSACVQVTIMNDDLLEDSEMFMLILSASTDPSVVLNPSSTAVTITDNGMFKY